MCLYFLLDCFSPAVLVYKPLNCSVLDRVYTNLQWADFKERGPQWWPTPTWTLNELTYTQLSTSQDLEYRATNRPLSLKLYHGASLLETLGQLIDPGFLHQYTPDSECWVNAMLSGYYKPLKQPSCCSFSSGSTKNIFQATLQHLASWNVKTLLLSLRWS